MLGLFQNTIIIFLPHGFAAGMCVCEAAFKSVFIH